MPLERHPSVELLTSARAFEGRIFDVVVEHVRLPSGLEQELAIVDHAGAVAICALTANGELLLVRQYRHATGKWMTEVPAGRLEAGEDPETAARRELEEETGHRARRWRLLQRFYPAPGFCSEHMWLFLARDLEPIADKRPHDDDEEIEVVRRTPEALLAEGADDAKTLIAALLVRSGAT
jgi:ADP-ribose pyrophosphatase